MKFTFLQNYKSTNYILFIYVEKTQDQEVVLNASVSFKNKDATANIMEIGQTLIPTSTFNNTCVNNPIESNIPCQPVQTTGKFCEQNETVAPLNTEKTSADLLSPPLSSELLHQPMILSAGNKNQNAGSSSTSSIDYVAISEPATLLGAAETPVQNSLNQELSNLNSNEGLVYMFLRPLLWQ